MSAEMLAASPNELLQLGQSVADEAADLILRHVGNHHQVDTKASPLDLVTEVDRSSEELIVGRLLSARPDDGILGEEGTRRVGTSGVEWVIDPIDGTTSFVYSLPGFAVSIAARFHGAPVAGIVAAPVIATTYRASTTDRLLVNDRTGSCSSCTDLSRALVATGFSPDDERRGRQAAHVAEVLPRIRDIRRMGSAALDLAAVACGQLDAYYEAGLSEWDWAAGAFLVEQGGGRIIVERDPDSGRAFIAAAAPGIADELFATLRSIGADRV